MCKRGTVSSAVAALAVAVWGVAAPAIAQTPPAPAGHAITSAERVARLVAEFEPLRRTTSPDRQQRIDAVAARIHREVDAFVGAAIAPDRMTRESVERDLRVVLPAATSEPPMAFTGEPREGRLAVVYMLFKAGVMGPGGTSVTLRQYVRRGGHLVLAAATASSDFDGYAAISAIPLPSPAPHGTWFLLSGRLTGANGPNTRMRIYAYEGRRFRTVWMPANVWGDFTVAVEAAGFTVTGSYYLGGTREERYAIAEDGVYRLPPR